MRWILFFQRYHHHVDASAYTPDPKYPISAKSRVVGSGCAIIPFVSIWAKIFKLYVCAPSALGTSSAFLARADFRRDPEGIHVCGRRSK